MPHVCHCVCHVRHHDGQPEEKKAKLWSHIIRGLILISGQNCRWSVAIYTHRHYRHTDAALSAPAQRDPLLRTLGTCRQHCTYFPSKMVSLSPSLFPQQELGPEGLFEGTWRVGHPRLDHCQLVQCPSVDDGRIAVRFRDSLKLL